MWNYCGACDDGERRHLQRGVRTTHGAALDDLLLRHVRMNAVVMTMLATVDTRADHHFLEHAGG